MSTVNTSRWLIDPRRLMRPVWVDGPRPGMRLWTPRRVAHAAITQSGWLVKTMLDVFDTTQLAIDLDLETHKIALFTDTVAPDFSVDTAYGAAPYNANETSGGGWAAGGVTLGSTVFTEGQATRAVFDCADVSNAASTIAAAMGGLVYADALAGNNAIFLIDFVSAVSSTAGTFEILFTAPAAGGVAYIDCY